MTVVVRDGVYVVGPLAGLPVRGTAEHLARLPLLERDAYLEQRHPAQLCGVGGDVDLNDPHIDHLIPRPAPAPDVDWIDRPNGTGGKVVVALIICTVAYFALRIFGPGEPARPHDFTIASMEIAR